MRRGGSALDVAVATTSAQGVVDTAMRGIGGKGEITVYGAQTGERTLFRLRLEVGSQTRPDLFASDFNKREEAIGN
jgi:gamma-glutamyltranspeptidase